MVCYLVIFTKNGFMRKVKRFFQASLPLILFNDNRDKTIEKAFRKNKNHRILKSIDTFRKKNEQTKVFITFQMHLYDFLCSAFIVLFFHYNSCKNRKYTYLCIRNREGNTSEKMAR